VNRPCQPVEPAEWMEQCEDRHAATAARTSPRAVRKGTTARLE
jgi:hypothetical protein